MQKKREKEKNAGDKSVLNSIIHVQWSREWGWDLSISLILVSILQGKLGQVT